MLKSAQIFLFAGVLGLASMAIPASATHSWNNYHWARTANPFTLKLGDNVSGAWDMPSGSSYLNQASTDWSVSSVLNTTVVTGTVDPRKCRPTSGMVQVCNDSYGRNG